jgi:hypothetical protein
MREGKSVKAEKAMRDWLFEKASQPPFHFPEETSILDNGPKDNSLSFESDRNAGLDQIATLNPFST